MDHFSNMNRRDLMKLLGGVTATSAISLKQAFSAPAPLVAARNDASGSKLPAAAAFNGGKTQINFNFPSGNSGEYPFLNLLKSAGTWRYAAGNGMVDPRDHDANGYPTVIRNGGQYLVTYIPSQAARPGNYVVTWEGNGTIYILTKNVPVSGSKTSTGGSGRYVFSTTDSQVAIGIQSIGSPRITNMKLYHIADEADVQAGKVFGAQFKARLRESNIAVYRFLNWQYGNSSNLTTWATRKPVGYVSYGGQELRASICAGVTTNSGDDFAVSLGSGAPTDKQTVTFKFNASKKYPKTSVTFGAGSVIVWKAHGLSLNDPVGFGGTTLPSPLTPSGNYFVSNVIDADTIQIATTPRGTTLALSGTASGDCFANRQPTLSLNSTAKVPLKDQSGSTLGTSNSPLSGAWATAVYDGALGSWLLFGGGPSTGEAGLSAGVPPEVCVQLCAEMGAHPYFVLPHLAADPLTDFSASLATYIRDKGPSWMIPRFEGCNELWNFAPGFYQTGYAINKACAYGWGPDVHNWMGKVMSVMGQAVSKVYSNDRTKYHVVCGVQTVVFNALPKTSQDPRLTSAKYVASGGSPASNWVTHVCCAQYIAPTLYGGSKPGAEEVALAAAYAAGDQTAPGKYVAGLASGSGWANLSSVANYYNNIAKWAAGLGVKRMCGYEGGYSADYGSNAQVNALRAAGKNVAALQDYTTKNYKNFLAAGGEFPSCFQLGGGAPSNNSWSVLEDIHQTSAAPQWLAIAAFNKS
ncbi:hypothetical protein [Bradyrhizobium japonicum]|uniref:hypothetical protein n=1 Tax=Bradyrhizobium japonicum TaxID=375 RepID=UPI000462B105|nr:hypothetical protein [Bradyrhizobium japonicum]